MRKTQNRETAAIQKTMRDYRVAYHAGLLDKETIRKLERIPGWKWSEEEGIASTILEQHRNVTNYALSVRSTNNKR